MEKLLFGSLDTKGRKKDKLGSSLRKSLYKDGRKIYMLMGQKDAAGGKGEKGCEHRRDSTVCSSLEEVRGGGRKSEGRGGASTGKRTSSYSESEGGALEQVWP